MPSGKCVAHVIAWANCLCDHDDAKRAINGTDSSENRRMADTGGITAQVVNIRNNQPIDGATVKLSGAANDSAATGSDGKFRFDNLAPGYNYGLDIAASGYQSKHYEDIVVIENNVTNLQKLLLGQE